MEPEDLRPKAAAWWAMGRELRGWFLRRKEVLTIVPENVAAIVRGRRRRERERE